MKTNLAKLGFRRFPVTWHRAGQRGSAVVVFLALLSIMLLLVAANGKVLILLKKELRLTEQRQVQRLEQSQINAPLAVMVPSGSDSTSP